MGNSGSRGSGGGSSNTGSYTCKSQGGRSWKDNDGVTNICIRGSSTGNSGNNGSGNYPSGHSSRGGEGREGGSVSSSNHHESRGSGSTGQDLSIKDYSSYLQSKFTTFDVGYGQIHSDAIIGTNPTSRGVPFMNEVIDTIRTEVSKGTLHHKLVINAYNRGLVDYDLYHLGIKLSGSTGTTTSGVTLNLCLFDLHQNNLTAYGMNNFLHFFKWQNIAEVNFSCNLLDDASCKQLSYALSAGDFPHLYSINLSSNKIGDDGAAYLAYAIGRGGAPKLNSLYIEGNNLTCIGKESLVKMACQIQLKQKVSVIVDYGTVFPNQQTDLIASNWYALQQKYSNIDVGYGKVHTHPIIGGSFYYRGIPFMNEVVDTVKGEVVSKTLHHKLVINGYNRELVDSDLYYLGFSLSGSTKPTTSGVTLNLSLLDLHQNSIAAPGIYNFVHFFKGQNIREVNLSNNQIDDKGAKLLADSLAKGNMPNLKKLHLEGNKITDEGEDALINVLKNENVKSIIITTMTIFEKYQLNINGSADKKMSIYENRLEQAKARGVDIHNVVVERTTWDWMKNKGKFCTSLFAGWVKCMVTYDDVPSFAGERLLAKLSSRTSLANDAKDSLLCYFEAENDALQTEEGVKHTKYQMLDVITSPELTGNIEHLYDTLYY